MKKDDGKKQAYLKHAKSFMINAEEKKWILQYIDISIGRHVAVENWKDKNWLNNKKTSNHYKKLKRQKYP